MDKNFEPQKFFKKNNLKFFTSKFCPPPADSAVRYSKQMTSNYEIIN
jgi:hypothetical protein